MPVLQLQRKNKKKELENAGIIEIKNKTEKTADLYFYGDIVSDKWVTEYEEEAQCPKTITDFLNSLENVSEIKIYFNSGGGDVFAGLAIAKQLKRYAAKKTGYIDGIAASIAGVMLVEACDTIIVPKNSMFMLHKPLTCCWGNADDFEKEIAILNKCQATILKSYMSKAKEGITEETITQLINEETWLTGEEMAQYFQIQLEEEMQISASCNSVYYDYYENAPSFLKNKKEEGKKEIEEIANLLAEKLKDIWKPDISEKEKRKEEILKGLDKI